MCLFAVGPLLLSSYGSKPFYSVLALNMQVNMHRILGWVLAFLMSPSRPWALSHLFRPGALSLKYSHRIQAPDSKKATLETSHFLSQGTRGGVLRAEHRNMLRCPEDRLIGELDERKKIHMFFKAATKRSPWGQRK